MGTRRMQTNGNRRNKRREPSNCFGRCIFQHFGLIKLQEFGTIHKSHPILYLPAVSNEVFYTIGNVNNSGSNLFNTKPRIKTLASKSMCCEIVDGSAESFSLFKNCNWIFKLRKGN